MLLHFHCAVIANRSLWYFIFVLIVERLCVFKKKKIKKKNMLVILF